MSWRGKVKESDLLLYKSEGGGGHPLQKKLEHWKLPAFAYN